MAGPSVGDMKTLRHQVSADEPWVARLEIVSMFVCSDILQLINYSRSVSLLTRDLLALPLTGLYCPGMCPAMAGVCGWLETLARAHHQSWECSQWKLGCALPLTPATRHSAMFGPNLHGDAAAGGASHHWEDWSADRGQERPGEARRGQERTEGDRRGQEQRGQERTEGDRRRQ